MAVGTSILSKVVTLGATVRTFAKVRDGIFQVSDGTTGAFYKLALRPSGNTGRSRRFGATYSYNPGLYDVATAVTNGRFTVTVNVDATIGSTVTRAAIIAAVADLASILAQPEPVASIIDGSTE